MRDEHLEFRRLQWRPSAWLPLAMSLTALVLVLAYVMVYGDGRPRDEGAVGHLWQLLMVAQVPLVLFFLGKWLPRARRATLLILGEQIGAALLSVLAVYLLGLG